MLGNWWRNVIHNAHVRYYWAGDADPKTGKTYQLGTEHTTWFGFFLLAFFDSIFGFIPATKRWFRSQSELFKKRAILSLIGLAIFLLMIIKFFPALEGFSIGFGLLIAITLVYLEGLNFRRL